MKKEPLARHPAQRHTPHVDFFVRYPWGGNYMEQLMPALDRLRQPWVEDPTAGSDEYRIFLAESKHTLRKAVRLIEQAYEKCNDGEAPDDLIYEAEFDAHHVVGVSSIAHDWKQWDWRHDVPILAGLGIELQVAKLPRAAFRVRLRRIGESGRVKLAPRPRSPR